MNDFMRDKLTPKKGEGTIPIYCEMIAGGTVSQQYIRKDAFVFAQNLKQQNAFADLNYNILSSKF